MGDFLARFAGKREHREERDEKAAKVARSELREALAKVQERALGRNKVATIDCDSSIHEGYADYSYDKRWSYSAVTLAEKLELGLPQS